MALDITKLARDFGDPRAEARACRTAAALFDFSFVRRARIEGPGAPTALATFTPRPVMDMRHGDIRYAVRCDSGGRLVSDLTIWRLGDDIFELMSGRAEDIADLVRAPVAGASCTDLSDAAAIFAVQGPGTLHALDGLCDTDHLSRLAYFKHTTIVLAGCECRVGRLGYTGEQGFELIVPRDAAAGLWQTLATRARPAGFIAADTLRIEAGFALFTNEFRLAVTPPEAGLAKFVAASANAPSLAQKVELQLACFAADERGIDLPWQKQAPPVRPAAAGEVAVTSACRSVVSDGLVLLGYARSEDLDQGAPLHDRCGEFTGLRRLALPCYDPGKRRPRMALRVPDRH